MTLSTSLEGKVAVITGAATRIGEQIARTLAAAGAAVVIGDVLDEPGTAVAQRIRDNGQQAIYVHADVGKERDNAALAEAAVQSFGRLDIWVSNAKPGIHSHYPVAEMSLETWTAMLDVALTGAFLGAKHAIPRMLQSGGGAIVNISSVHAIAAYPHEPAYDVAKAGLLALTRSIAADYGPQGIRANTILPGLIVPDALHDDPTELMQAVTPLYSVGRAGRFQDIADAVLFLVSDAAGFINGTTLVVDGGMTSKSPEFHRWNPKT